MKYVTQEETHHPGFVMPVAIAPCMEAPQAGEGYYAVLFWRERSLILEDCTDRFVFHGPGAVCVTPNHTIRHLSIRNDDDRPDHCFSLIFKPEGLNSNQSSFPDTFEYGALTRIDNGYTYRYLPEPVAIRLERLCKDIHKQLNIERSMFWPCLSRSYILEVLLLIERTRYGTGGLSDYTIPQCNEQTRKVFEYIHSNYQDDMNLASLSERFGTNRTTLNRLFKEACGMTVMAYLGKIRITVASLLLRNTTLSIQEISWRIGLNDEAYFSRLFRSRTGLSPSEFRLNYPHPYGHVRDTEAS